MQRFKKSLKLLGLIGLIALALVGISIAGAPPLTGSNKKEENVEIKIELVLTDENKKEVSQIEYKP